MRPRELLDKDTAVEACWECTKNSKDVSVAKSFVNKLRNKVTVLTSSQTLLGPEGHWKALE